MIRVWHKTVSVQFTFDALMQGWKWIILFGPRLPTQNKRVSLVSSPGSRPHGTHTKNHGRNVTLGPLRKALFEITRASDTRDIDPGMFFGHYIQCILFYTWRGMSLHECDWQCQSCSLPNVEANHGNLWRRFGVWQVDRRSLEKLHHGSSALSSYLDHANLVRYVQIGGSPVAPFRKAMTRPIHNALGSSLG